ncbi:MAG TPA: hypothetical protein VH722_19630 [Alphaproteobacteria bacterium]|jgi:hypothetical protein|nr:hypothetical protein [Alphaproteobacteria bacterium]
MSSSAIKTTVHDVLDPLTGQRRSLRWSYGGAIATAPSFVDGEGRDIDGADLWVLPPLYDADAHLPFIPFGVRHSDIQKALAGGIAQFNVALPWQLARNYPLADLAADLGRTALPRIIPLLSVSPDADSAGFPAWLRNHVDELRQFTPPICKLYSDDPNFAANLEAIWEVGLEPMVWCWTWPELEALVERAGDRPLHHRHATSSEMVALMQKATSATLQTSPHFLLLAGGKRGALTVLPPPPPEEQAGSLAKVFLDEVDIIVTDHNAPPVRGNPTGPGLQTQQTFLQTLLTLAESHDWPLDRVLAKATTAPASLFETAAPSGFLLVDPDAEPSALWPGQGPDRAPFEGLPLKGRVLAVGAADRVELL